jgi:NADH-quinone oxidoreductase subunit L
MTRLMAMTFWGKERFLDGHAAGGEADEAHASAYDKGQAQHDALTGSAGDRPHHQPGEHVGAAIQHDEHSHAAHVHIPHESPKSMWVPLVVLAVLAVIGGFVGVGPAFRFITGSEHPGGNLNIVNWLDPIVWNPTTKEFGTGEHANTESHAAPAPAEGHAPATEAGHGASVYGDTGFNLAHSVEKSLGELGTEWLFIILSLVVAGLGIALGWFFYLKDPSLPDAWAARLGPLYRASYNKYGVDEFYGMAITRRTMDLARAVFSFDSKIVDGIVNGVAALTRLFSRIVGGIDKYFVDGLVNTIAAFIARLMSPLFRAAQTGFAQNYALVMVLGLMLGVVVLLWSDIMKVITSFFGLHY